MKTYKNLLLVATSAAGLLSATGANAAGVLYPSAEIHGNGASSIINVLNKTLQCLGNPDQPIGFGANGSTDTFPTHNYVPITPSISNPVYHCDTQSIQSQITGHYVSTGSGAGKQDWRLFNQSGIAVMPSSFTSAYADGHIQYALSDSAIASSDLTAYNDTTVSTSPIRNGTGPAIQIPFYVLPIAISYPPVYGKINNGSGAVPLAFNVKSTFVQKAGDGSVTGGLRLNKSAYCKIVNGQITNWNDAALKTLNGGQSLMDPADDLARWNSDGVPIVLVGRNDNSGTTNLFTRAMTAQCGSTGINLPGNKFTAGGKDGLASGYPTAVGTARYDKATGALTTGSEAAGLFGLVDGSDGIATVVGQSVADSDVPNPGDRKVRGFAGYVGADFVRPATIGTVTPAVYAAALQVGTGTSYMMPTAANATAAFGTTYLPPQSNTSGTYNPTTPAPGSAGLRNNPLDWVLAANATSGLANPVKGYPITGTTNLLLYTCYNTPAKRAEVVALAALQFGKLGGTQTPTGSHFPVALANSTGKGADGLSLGILARNGLANLPGPWKTAIWETFFAKIVSGNNPSALNLWIQDKLPTSTALIDGNTGNGEVSRNTTQCPLGTEGA